MKFFTLFLKTFHREREQHEDLTCNVTLSFSKQKDRQKKPLLQLLSKPKVGQLFRSIRELKLDISFLEIIHNNCRSHYIQRKNKSLGIWRILRSSPKVKVKRVFCILLVSICL